MQNRTISLVLGAGGAKGYAHIGAIEAIEEFDYKIVSIAGTSMGSLIGGLYAAGKLKEAKEWFQSIGGFKKIFGLVDIKNISTKGLINGDYIFKNLERIIGKDLKLSELKMPFCCVADDINSGQEIVFTNDRLAREGESDDKRIVYIKDVSLLDAIRASISMPAIFIPHEVKGRQLVDGGATNGLPINHLKRIKDSKVVAINLDTYGDTSMFDLNAILSRSRTTKILSKIATAKEKNNFATIFLNSLYVGMKHNKLLMIEHEKPDIYVNIDLKEYGTFSFTEADKILNLGYEQLKKKMEELTYKKRLAIWQEELLSARGTTFKEMAKRGHCDIQRARQDLQQIKGLIAGTGATIFEIGGPMKKNSLKLSKKVDLLSLYAQSNVAAPYRDLLKMLTQSRGLLSSSFFKEMSTVYDDIISHCNTDDKVIEFESNLNETTSMPFFTQIYRALRKDVLMVTRHKANTPDKTFRVVMHPEFLKEYNSQWYVFGNVCDPVGEEPKLDRIPLSVIDDISMPTVPMKFVPTGHTPTGYHQMLSEVIGVEVDENCPLETVSLRVSTKMFHRLMSNPLHHSQKAAPELDAQGSKGLQIKVRRNKELIRSILSMGSDIEVVAPSNLRNSVKKELLKNQQRYQ